MVSKQLRHRTEPVGALCHLAVTAYLNRLEDISDQERRRAAATRLTSSGGMKAW